MTPEPGIYHNVPDWAYRRWDLPSQSLLNGINRSPAHASVPKYFAGAALGTATHLAILQPEIYLESVYILPKLDLRFKKDKEEKQQLVEENDGKIIISYEDGQTIERMKNAVDCNNTARSFLSRIVHTEVSVVFDWNGVRMKARLDAVTNDDYILDLKTTQDASPQGFAKSIATFGYAGQAATYSESLSAHGREVRGFVFIAVEKEEPHGVACYQLDEKSLDFGRRRIERALETYSMCKKYNYFPAYPDEVRTLSLPGWAMNEAEVQGEW